MTASCAPSTQLVFADERGRPYAELRLLPGGDPVLRWVSGTGACPVLEALPGPLRSRFETEYGARLREAHPEQPHGTALPFRRVSRVVHRADGAL